MRLGQLILGHHEITIQFYVDHTREEGEMTFLWVKNGHVNSALRVPLAKIRRGNHFRYKQQLCEYAREYTDGHITKVDTISSFY